MLHTKFCMNVAGITSLLYTVKYLKDKDGLKRFGERVRQYRLARNLSQEGLAYESGLSYSHINRIERGELNAGLSTVFMLARTLEVELKDLFDFSLPPLKTDQANSSE